MKNEMEFDNLKSAISKVKAPEIAFRINKTRVSSVDGFISYLKKIDKKQKKVYLISCIGYFLITAIWMSWFVLTYRDTEPIFRISRALYVIAFGSFAFYLMKQYGHHRDLGYDLPPNRFLHKAMARHILWSRKLLILIPCMLLIDVAATIEFSGIWANMPPPFGILIFQLAFFVIFGGGFLIGVLVWKIEKAPVVDVIEQLMEEFEDLSNVA